MSDLQKRINDVAGGGCLVDIVYALITFVVLFSLIALILWLLDGSGAHQQ